MKRRALLGHLQAHGCVSVREGGSHSIWSNPQTGRKESIRQHSEIKKARERSLRKVPGRAGFETSTTPHPPLAELVPNTTPLGQISRDEAPPVDVRLARDSSRVDYSTFT